MKKTTAYLLAFTSVAAIAANTDIIDSDQQTGINETQVSLHPCTNPQSRTVKKLCAIDDFMAVPAGMKLTDTVKPNRPSDDFGPNGPVAELRAFKKDLEKHHESYNSYHRNLGF